MFTSFWKAQQKLWQTQWMACTLICRQTAGFQMSIFCNIHWHTESYKIQIEMLCHWLPTSQTIVHSDPKEMKLWLIWQWWLWDVLRALRGAMHRADVLSKALPVSNTWDNCTLYIHVFSRGVLSLESIRITFILTTIGKISWATA